MLKDSLEVGGNSRPTQILDSDDLQLMGLSEEEFYNLALKDSNNGLILENLTNE